MAIINCIDCGKEYDSEVKICPNCGCPTTSQIVHAEQMPRQTVFIQNIEQQNKTKKLLLWILPIVFSGIVAAGIIYCFGHSYGRKMAQFNKKATEFKASLDLNCQVISETIDSLSQKVFYIEKNTENYDYYGAPYHKILMHDYATGETKPVLPYTGEIDDYNLCGVEFVDSKLLRDRLFFMVQSNCMWRLAETGIFYVNIRDNSLHYVESCNKAEFIGMDEMCIHKYFDLRRYENEGATEYKEYYLSTMLDDAEYAENRQKQKKIEKELAEEWWNKEEMNSVKEWLIGTWESNGWDEWLGRYTSYVCITENNLRLGYNGQDIYDGPYEINKETHQIIFDRHDGYYTQIGFNPQTQRLEDEAGVFRKVSNGVSSVSYSSNNSSRQTTDESYREVQRLQDEVRLLIDKMTSYRSKMSYSVYGSYEYQNARIEYRRLIGTAIEKQKKAIKIARNKIHDESLAIGLEAQLELLEAEKRSEDETDTRRGREFSRRGY